jgi:hypothetical protein
MEKKPGFRGFDLFANDGRFEAHLIHQYPDNAIKVKTKDKFELKKWDHVFVTYDGSGKGAGVKLFVDGRERDLEIEKDKLTNSITTTEPLRIGSRNQEANFTGLVDDIRFYGRALSADEVRLLTFQAILPIVTKSGGKRTQEERDDLRRFYKDNYAADFLHRSRTRQARTAKDDLIKAIPSSMIMERDEPARETFQLVRGDFRIRAKRSQRTLPRSCLQ